LENYGGDDDDDDVVVLPPNFIDEIGFIGKATMTVSINTFSQDSESFISR